MNGKKNYEAARQDHERPTRSNQYKSRIFYFIRISKYFLLLGLFSACGKKKNELEIKIIPQTSLVLYGTYSSTCLDAELSEPRAYFSKFRLSWTGEGDFTPTLVQVKFEADKDKMDGYTFDITGDIAEVYFNLSDGKVRSGQNLVSRCPSEFDSISIKNENLDFTATGTLSVFGYYEKGDSQIPVSASTILSIQQIVD